MLKNKSILITGGTGSFGKAFVEKLLNETEIGKIIIYSRDELKQFEMANIYKDNPEFDKLRFFVGDVRDINRLIWSMEEVDYVIHAAALKQVLTGEYNPFEVIKTNVLGAQNVIEAAMKSNVKKVVALSTDKAASPLNLYGASKLCSDKLFVAANSFVGKRDIKFSVVRYGNVLNSRGSVVPFFKSLKKGDPFPITDERMTRFNILRSEGVEFVLKCLSFMWGGETFIPKIPSYNVLDLAKAIDPNCKIKIIGIRPGEKLHEEMITKMDSFSTIEFKDYFVILPTLEPNWKLSNFLKESSTSTGKRVMEEFSYSSEKNDTFLSVKEIRELIDAN